MQIDQLTLEDIQRKLENHQRGPAYNHYPPGVLNGRRYPAGVLISFLRQENAWHILYIRRTEAPNDRHSGQVAFPGGRSEPQDKDIIAAALREAHEEINLAPIDVQVLGQLNSFITITNYHVTPVVGVIPWPYAFKLQQGEVNRVFTIPLAWLADPDNHNTQFRRLPQHGEIPVTYFKEYDGETLWGASASFTLELLRTIL